MTNQAEEIWRRIVLIPFDVTLPAAPFDPVDVRLSIKPCPTEDVPRDEGEP